MPVPRLRDPRTGNKCLSHPRRSVELLPHRRRGGGEGVDERGPVRPGRGKGCSGARARASSRCTRARRIGSHAPAVGRPTDARSSSTTCFLGAVATVEALEQALDGAERDGKLNRRLLLDRIANLDPRGRTGAGALRSILEARQQRARLPRSVLERRFLRLCRRYALPLPVCRLAVSSRTRTSNATLHTSRAPSQLLSRPPPRAKNPD
jgi:hypothetical protein